MKSRNIFITSLLIIVISTALKLYYARICSLFVYCDAAIIGNIARDILNGQYRLFFYGQHYLWVIESWIMAGFFFLLGSNRYTIYLTPIFVSVLYLISIYFLGKEFKNREVGFFALIYAAFPPFYFFNHSVIPQGYHILLPLFGNLILLLTLIITRAKTSLKGLLYFLLLGLVSGASFWLHFIAVYYLAAAALFLFLNFIVSRRFLYYLSGGIIGLFSFFAGGLPCWIYCIKNDFISFAFSAAGAPYSITAGVKKFLSYQVPGILGGNLCVTIIFAAAIIYLILSIKPTKEKNINKNWLFIFLFVSMAVLFSRGGAFVDSADHRYILPILSLIPVVMAFFVSWIKSKNKYLGWSLLTVLILVNLFSIAEGIARDKHDFAILGGKYGKLIDFFAENNIEGVFCRLADSAIINYLCGGKVSGTGIKDGKHPVEDEVVGSSKVAYLNYKWLSPMLNMLCKSYKENKISGISVVYDFDPWDYYGREIVPIDWKVSASHNKPDAQYAIDRNLDYCWSSNRQKETGMYFEVEFPNVYKIYKFEVFNMPQKDQNLPIGYSVSVSLDGEKWETVAEQDTAGPMFWSGPNVLWRVVDTRWEVIFHPVSARFVRIENMGNDENGMFFEINEIAFYEYTGDKNIDWLSSAEDIYDFLKHEDIKFVYADYWLSAKVKLWSSGSIDTLNIKNDAWRNRQNISRLMEIDGKTAIIVEKENSEGVGKILTEIGIEYNSEEAGEFVCFYSFSANNRYNLGDLKNLYWIGAGIAKINSRGLGELLIDSDPSAIKYYSGNVDIHKKLLDHYGKAGETDKYDEIAEIIKRDFTPQNDYGVIFRDGIKFLGWSVFPENIDRGGEFIPLEKDTDGVGGIPVNSVRGRSSLTGFIIDYYWEVDIGDVNNMYVFVHFVKGGKTVFQNDHQLLKDYIRPHVDLRGGVWKESYRVKVPLEVESGDYIVRLGLWLPYAGGRRLEIEGSGESGAEIGRIRIRQSSGLSHLKGEIVFESGKSGRKQIYLMNADGSNVRQLTESDGDNSYPSFSPDGREIVFVSTRDGKNEVYVMDSEGNNQRRVTNSPGNNINPSWYPDGNRIIFVSDMDGGMDFYRVNKNGAELAKITDFGGGVNDLPEISPDGGEIVYLSNKSLSWQVFKMNIDGGDDRRITPLTSGHCEAGWSHDGKYIVCIKRFASGNSDVCIMDSSGENARKITDSDKLNYNPRFSSDDKYIIFCSNRDGNWEIYAVPASGDGAPERLTYTNANENWPDWRI